MISESKLGFEYTVEVVKNGIVIDREVIHNLMPVEGINHVLDVVFKSGTQVPTWYVGVYENAYTPISTDTMATFPSVAGELTSYDALSRVAFVGGAVTGGALDNIASKAEFDFTTTKTVAGGFISSSLTKGGTLGVLVSAVRFASPKSVDADSTLRITAGFTMASI